MPDNLRDRIAAVITSHVYNEWHVDESEQCMCRKCGASYPDHVADAVIAALGRYEYAELDGLELHPGEQIVRRYVTDWEADQ